MACFLVPTAEAIVVTAAEKAAKDHEKEVVEITNENDEIVEAEKIPFSRKLRWLTNLLWGGAVLLCFEHIWHGEVVPWFPFLTAASDPSDRAVMLHEMGTTGVTMAILVTIVWCGMLLISNIIEKRAIKEAAVQEGKA